MLTKKTVKTLAKIGGIWLLCEISVDLGKAAMYKAVRIINNDTADTIRDVFKDEEIMSNFGCLKKKRLKFISKLCECMDEAKL